MIFVITHTEDNGRESGFTRSYVLEAESFGDAAELVEDMKRNKLWSKDNEAILETLEEWIIAHRVKDLNMALVYCPREKE